VRIFYSYFIITILFIQSSFLFAQEKTYPPVNDSKFFNGEWQQENIFNVTGYLNYENSELTLTDSFVTQVFTSNNLVVIPDVVSVVSDSLFVSGLDNVLIDLNLQTFIQHTYCSDLDITLQSPTGKIVTVTSDNGANLENVFNGTVWDDQANPGGQVPYSTNSGLVTDHNYTNLVTATPLAPEESFALFAGDNPNGWWYLTISDDQNEDGGILTSWSLEITTIPSLPLITFTDFSFNTGLIIPTTVSTDSVLLEVNGLSEYLVDLNVTTWLRHSYNADLDITLKSPQGTIVTLTSDNGSDKDDVFNGTLWDDQADPGGQLPYQNNDYLVTDRVYEDFVTATPLVPEEPFEAFLGENPNGTWVLKISDDTGGDAGVLDSVQLHFATTENILPVELISFDFKLADGGINLSWVTSSELNNKGFELQKFNKNKWEVVSFIEGRGTTAGKNYYSFLDKKVTSGNIYQYRLKQINFDGTFQFSKTIEVNYLTELSYHLYQNYPNPFNPVTSISFSLPEEGRVKLTVHNLIGETVAIILDKKMEKGIYSFSFDASSLTSGIYFYRLEVNDFVSTKKMILLR